MGRLGRIGWICKWAGLVICLLFAIAWVTSLFRNVSLGWQTFVALGDGSLSLFNDNNVCVTVPFWLHTNPISPRSYGLCVWRGSYDTWLGIRCYGTMPLWIPLLVIAVPTTLLWWRGRRRVPPDHCQQCGYNLTGNVSGVCPECGARRSENELHDSRLRDGNRSK